MSFRTRMSVVAITVVVLVTAGIWATAQQVGQPTNLGNVFDLVAPTVIAGSDLGFRVESTRDGIPVARSWFALMATGSMRRSAAAASTRQMQNRDVASRLPKDRTGIGPDVRS
jgi:hypothetical protein